MPPDNRAEIRDAPVKQEQSMEARLASLEAQLAAARQAAPLGSVPDHGAGIGQNVHETWSQAEQEAARNQVRPSPK